MPHCTASVMRVVVCRSSYRGVARSRWARVVVITARMISAPTMATRVAAFAVWGSNTGVGKTLVSAGIVRAAAVAQQRVFYLKPVQTGLPQDSDGALVATLAGGRHTLGAHAGAVAHGEMTAPQPTGGATPPHCRTLFGWKAAVSPHLAVVDEGRAVSDDALLDATRRELEPFLSNEMSPADTRLALVETAGGVASPGPSGALQCDVLAPLRLPAVLVADGRLGGISASICAAEVRRDAPLELTCAVPHRPCRHRPTLSHRSHHHGVSLPSILCLWRPEPESARARGGSDGAGGRRAAQRGRAA